MMSKHIHQKPPNSAGHQAERSADPRSADPLDAREGLEARPEIARVRGVLAELRIAALLEESIGATGHDRRSRRVHRASST